MTSQEALFIFTDSSADKGKNLCGIGMVFYKAVYRGNWFQVGSRVLEKSELHPGDRSSFAERLALFRGLQIALEMGYGHVFIFNDHLSVVKKLNSRMKEQDSKISEIEKKICALQNSFQFLKIGYLKKRKNSLPHKLSRKAFQNLP